MAAGGWAALAVAGLGVLRLGVAAQVYAAGPGGSSRPDWSLALGAVGMLAALAQGLAVDGVRRRLGPDTRLLWTVSAAGWTGAALAAVGALAIAGRALTSSAPTLASGLLLGWLAAFATALWAAGVCAADWRLRRLPAWLRVTGTAYAVFSLAAAVLPPLGVLALPLALVWWIGLGAVLLRRPGSTAG